jgi:hypothetical protein
MFIADLLLSLLPQLEPFAGSSDLPYAYAASAAAFASSSPREHSLEPMATKWSDKAWHQVAHSLEVPVELLAFSCPFTVSENMGDDGSEASHAGRIVNRYIDT